MHPASLAKDLSCEYLSCTMLWVVLTETKLETLWQVNKNVRTHLLPKETTPRLLLILKEKTKKEKK
jgi:hypothetical protein